MHKLDEFEKLLGLKFQQKKLLSQALTHRSYLNENKVDYPSNERLEFLGDAILSFLVSEHLYHHFPNYSEGQLTNLRSAIVRTETLADVAQSINIGKYLFLSHGEEAGGGRENPSLLADAVEAIIAAIFLDQGLDKVKKFVNQHVLSLIPKIVAKQTLQDSKSLFQEKVQEVLRVSPTYKVLKEEGLDHAKIFHVGVYVKGELYGKGIGKSKQQAEKRAAMAALEKWQKKR